MFYGNCNKIAGLLIITLYSCTNTINKKFNPYNPYLSNYHLVFSDEFDSISTIDINESGEPRFKWFTTPFFIASSKRNSSNISVNNGVLTLTSNDTSVLNTNIATAMPSDNDQGWIGNAFHVGAYFEARISFDSTQIDTSKGWPSFWSMGIEHMANKGADLCHGKANGYKHFIEDDFFEYVTASFSRENSYAATMHDWYGIYKKTCPKGFCDINNTPKGGSNFKNAFIKTSNDIDWTEFHTIGQLWIPASADHTGYVQNYFDGKLMSTVTWDKADSLDTVPPTGNQVFNIIDQSNLVLILGTGINQPLKVDWVRVWQI